MIKGTLSLTAASPAQSFTEPMTLAEIRHYLKIVESSPSDSEEDSLLEMYIAAARETAEIMQGRDLVQKQWDLTLAYFDFTEIALRPPLSSVDRVQYTDSDGIVTAMAENTDYIVDLARGVIMPPYGGSWPSFTAWPTSAVLVRFTSGYAPGDAFWSDAGKRIIAGMKLLIAQWYENRENVNVGNIVNELPYAVTALFQFGANNRII